MAASLSPRDFHNVPLHLMRECHRKRSVEAGLPRLVFDPHRLHRLFVVLVARPGVSRSLVANHAEFHGEARSVD